MLKIAFVFPGQGSQGIGMGRDIIEKYRETDELFDKANKLLITEGLNLKKLWLEGPEEELTKTANAQPLMLTLNSIFLALLKNNNINPYIVAGHSLGEYSALVSASSIKFKDAIRLVRERGQYMQDATPYGFGTMAAVISLNKVKIERIIKEVNGSESIEIANHNSSYQVVVSGKSEAIEKLMESLVEDGDVNIVPLKVSAPFHTSFMKKAKERLSNYLENIDISNPQIPIISNVTADYLRTEDEIRNALTEQVTNSVKWVDIINKMNSEGIDCYVEVGPGNVLKKLIKQIIPTAKVYSTGVSKDFERVIAELKNDRE